MTGPDTEPLALTPQLRAGRLREAALICMQISDSSPGAVLIGGITATLAVTGSLGVVLAFPVVGLLVLLPFAVGLAEMIRHVPGAGAFYTYITRGLGGVAGVAGGFLAVLTYNAIQIGLYGLLGYALSGTVGEWGLTLPWWVWAALVWAVIGAFGLARIEVSVRVAQVALAVELVAVLAFIAAAVVHPGPDGLTAVGWHPGVLFGPALGAVLAFTMAAYQGFETGPAYAQETVDARRNVPRAMTLSLVLIAVGYGAAAWALLTLAGTAGIQTAAAQGPALVFRLFAERFGPVAATTVSVVFVTSVFGAMLGFHNVVARYLHALARERVLPPVLARVSAGARAPVAGSLTQTVIAAVVVLVAVAVGADPVLGLFTAASGLAAVSFVALLALTSLAVARHVWLTHTVVGRAAAPIWAAVGLLAMLVVIVANFGALVGPDSPLRWLLPALAGLVAVAGAAWGAVLRRRSPEVYGGIGRAYATEGARP
jgi:amino acid transporter